MAHSCRLAVVALCSLAGCSDTAASVGVEPHRVIMEPGDDVDIEVEAFTDDGERIPSPVAKFVSSRSSVASVDADAWVIDAHAVGEATITVWVNDVSSAVSVWVVGPGMRARLVDED